MALKFWELFSANSPINNPHLASLFHCLTRKKSKFVGKSAHFPLIPLNFGFFAILHLGHGMKKIIMY